MNVTIGSAIKSLRIRSALTQEQLAEQLGVDRGRVCRWERGENVPSLKNIRKIADALGCSTSDLTKYL